ncbi:GNAT family N-acetyltransferase [Virgibacillus sp. NKC19-16]|uniref:GNAT family N-acetyltransferase n=1 Tax=Virgibacillus salidurans TaxID=2831673 RepID=UPI001F36EDC8|nr:GNAT family N-acetyltransferase [Virgibacillus sp. NKC19-16]UJL46666.1 GNAT family N-acetyltransferase [Virgibacillus sp. NKC19-16]
MNLFNIIKNEQKYWLVDQVKRDSVVKGEYKDQLEQLLPEWKQENVDYLSLVIDESFHNWLVSKGFHQVSTTVEYKRKLSALPEINNEIRWHSLSEGWIGDADYGNLYDRCSSGSANKSSQAKDQFLLSLESELGVEWRNHCFYFTKNEALIGICIPHIEMGTENEGRLFYFGVVPEWRKKGIGTEIHKIALRLLHQLEATYYIGSTDISNVHMAQIFKQNGCVLHDRKGQYRIAQTP